MGSGTALNIGFELGLPVYLGFLRLTRLKGRGWAARGVFCVCAVERVSEWVSRLPEQNVHVSLDLHSTKLLMSAAVDVQASPQETLILPVWVSGLFSWAASA